MKRLIGTLAFAAVAATAAGMYIQTHHAAKFAIDPDQAEGRTPGDPLAAAIRLGYHGNAGNLRFEPAWLRESAKQDAKMPPPRPLAAAPTRSPLHRHSRSMRTRLRCLVRSR